MPFHQALDPLRSLAAAWKLFKQAPGLLLLGGFLLWLFDPDQVLHFVLAWIEARVFGPPLESGSLLVVWLGLGGVVLLFVLSSWLEVGFARTIQRQVSGDSAGVAGLFGGAGRFGAMLLGRLLGIAIVLASSAPFVAALIGVYLLEVRTPLLFGARVLLIAAITLAWMATTIWIGLGLVLLEPVLALEDLRATQAVARSWQLARGHRLQLGWFVLATTLLCCAGFCACCLGYFLAMPLVQTMRFETYLALTRSDATVLAVASDTPTRST